jgi:hypothetical protein
MVPLVVQRQCFLVTPLVKLGHQVLNRQCVVKSQSHLHVRHIHHVFHQLIIQLDLPM